METQIMVLQSHILIWVRLKHWLLTFAVKEYVTIKFIPELKHTTVIFEVDVCSRVPFISKTIVRTSYIIAFNNAWNQTEFF